MVDETKLLNELQGIWERLNQDEECVHVKINGDQVLFEENDEPITLMFRNDIDRWVIPGGMTVWQLYMKDGKLNAYVPSNGPFPETNLVYTLVV